MHSGDSDDDDLRSSAGFSSTSGDESEEEKLQASMSSPCSAYRLTFGAAGLRKRKGDRLASLYHHPDVCLALYLGNRPLWKTEVIKQATEPVWEAFVLHRERIGAGDISNTVLRVEVWDWRDGEVHLVGQASVPFETLITPGFEAPLINPKKKNSFSLRGKYKDSGKVQLMSVTEERDLRWSGEPPRGYEMVIRGDKLDAKDISKVSSSHSFLLFKTAQGVVHRTEVVKGTVQPRWKPILLELDHVGALGKYYYGWRRQQILHPSREVEQQQPWLDEYIVIECWNWQANGRHELIGVSSVLCMRDFLTCTRYQFTLINKEKKEREVPVLSDFAKEFTGMSVRVPYRHSGILYVEAIETIPEDLDEPQLIPEAFILDMSASKLDNRGLAKAISAAPNPFLRIRTGAWGGNRVIFQTEHDIKTEEPHWKPFALTVADCGGIRQNIVIECRNYAASGEDELIGQFEASLVELTSEKLDTYFFVNPSKIDWIGYRHSGKLKVCYFRPISAQEALEFIEGYHVTLAPLLLAPPPLFPHARMPHGCFVKVWNVEEGVLAAQTEVILPETVRQDRWRPMVLDIGKVPSIDTPLDFDIWWKNNEDEEMDLLLGTFRATLRRFANYQKSPQFPIGRPVDAQQHQLSSAVVGLPMARGSEHSVSIHRSGEGNYEEVHIHASGADTTAKSKPRTGGKSQGGKGEYEDIVNGKGKEKEVDNDDDDTNNSPKGSAKKGKRGRKSNKQSRQQGGGPQSEGSDPLSRLRRKTEDVLGSGNGSRGTRTSPGTKKPASAERRSSLGYLAVKEFWVVGVSEVDLTPLRKKKNKQAKGESGGGERVLSYAKTITHNLLPLMKTRGERSGLDDSSAVATESEYPTDTGASSSSVTPDRTKGGAMKPAWSLSSMIPKSNSKDLRHQVGSKRRRKHEQAIHDTNYIDLVEPSPVLPKEDQPAGEETETEETETESEEEREEEEERSAESSESRSRHTTSPEGTDGSDNYADASAMEDDRDGAGDVNSKAAREGGGGDDVKRNKKATAKEKRDIKERKEEKALDKKKKKKGGPVYAVLS